MWLGRYACVRCDYWGVSAPSVVPSRPGAGRATAALSAAAAAASASRTPRGLLTASITVVVGLLLLLPIGAVLQIVLTSQLDDRSTTQAIVVMDPARSWGAAEPVLQARLDHAAELYRQGTAPVIIVTGPHRGEGAARDYLARLGIPGVDVVAFRTGADTVGSLQVIASVMRDLQWQSLTLVTDPAQAARAQATASGFGLDAHVSPTRHGSGTALTSESIGRETIALLRYYLLTRWSQPRIVTAS